jgi:hypothetical protein
MNGHGCVVLMITLPSLSVHSTRTVAALFHAAPEVLLPEVAARLLHRLAVDTGELLFANPAGVVVGRANAGPAVASLLDGDGLAAQQLGGALGVLAWLSAHGRDIHRAEDVHAA